MIKTLNINPLDIEVIELHHSAIPDTGKKQIEQVNTIHKNKDWGNGAKQPMSSKGYYITYNEVMDVDNEFTVTRPLGQKGFDSIGNNCTNLDNCKRYSLCVFGDYTWQIPSEEKINKLNKKIEELKQRFPNAEIGGHGDQPHNKTACPGKLLEYLPKITTKKNRFMQIIDILKKLIGLQTELNEIKANNYNVRIHVPEDVDFSKYKKEVEGIFKKAGIPVLIETKGYAFTPLDVMKQPIIPEVEFDIDWAKAYNKYQDNNFDLIGIVFGQYNYEKGERNYGSASKSYPIFIASRPPKTWDKKRKENGVIYGTYLGSSIAHEITHLLITIASGQHIQSEHDSFHTEWDKGRFPEYLQDLAKRL